MRAHGFQLHVYTCLESHSTNNRRELIRVIKQTHTSPFNIYIVVVYLYI